MTRSRKINRDKVQASLDTPCPKCGLSISPAMIRRVDFDRVECPKWGEKFAAGAGPAVRSKMGKLIELPSRKALDYISIHAAEDRWGWRVTHHYVDGKEEDVNFSFEDAEEMMLHLRERTHVSDIVD